MADASMVHILLRYRQVLSAIDKLLPLLKGKRVGLVVNQTSTVGNTLLLDTLHQLGVNVTAAFAPEHGVRGNADAGAKVGNEVDTKQV